MKLLLISLFISGICYGQKKDSVIVKKDSAEIIMRDFLIFLQDKITFKEYIPFEKAVSIYLRQRELLKPKNK